MKYRGVLFLIVLLAAGQAAAQQQLSSTSISKAASERRVIHWLAPGRAANSSDYSRSVGGLSQQAWTTQVGWHPDVSAFADDKNYGSGWCLLWIGHNPWHHELVPVRRE